MTFAKKNFSLLAVLGLAALSLLFFFPAFHNQPLNIDESFFDSMAHYALTHQQNASSLFHHLSFAPTLHQWTRLVFGEHSLAAMRVLVWLGHLVCAWFVYLTAIELTRFKTLSFLTALGFLALSVAFEGWISNREWHANVAIVPAFYLLTRLPSHQLTYFFIGLVFCAATLGKWQAAPIALVPLVFLTLQSLFFFRKRIWQQRLVMVLAGYAFTIVSYFVYLFANGDLASVLEHCRNVVPAYAFKNHSYHSLWFDPAQWQRLLFHFVSKPPHKLFFALALCTGLTLLVKQGHRLLQKKSHDTQERELLLVLYFFSSCLSIAVGGRFFYHYYLLLLAPLSLMCAYSVSLWGKSRYGLTWVMAASLLLVRLSAFRLPKGMANWIWEASHSVYLIACAPVFAWVAVLLLSASLQLALRRPFIQWSILSIIGVQYCLLASTPFFAASIQPRRSYSQVVDYVRNHSQPSESIQVWGWRPEIYTASNRTPASRENVAQYVVGDLNKHAKPLEYFMPNKFKTMLEEMQTNAPTIFIDAWARSNRMSNRWIYHLKHYPQLLDHLNENYTRVTHLDGMDIYQRLPKGS